MSYRSTLADFENKLELHKSRAEELSKEANEKIKKSLKRIEEVLADC